jgi:hypothetical protein
MVSNRRVLWAGCLLLLAAVRAYLEVPNPRQSYEVTLTRDVEPILHRHCITCHNPDGIGPFSLLSREDTLRMARMIKEVVQTRRMPPWSANPVYGKFKNARQLAQAEIDTITQWVEGGRLIGPESDTPRVSQTPDWKIGKPDVIFKIPVEMHLPPAGIVPYAEFTIPSGFTEDRWVQAAEVQPGNPRVLHHMTVIANAPGAGDVEVGAFQGLARGLLCSFTPGTDPMMLASGQAMRIPKDTTFNVTLHYTTTGKPETDRTCFGFVFAKSPPSSEVFAAMTANIDFTIPPRHPDYKVEASVVVPRDAFLHAMTPHMHMRGKAFEYIAHYPDGGSETLLEVLRYNFDWQTSYILEEPVRLPAGTRIQTIATYDNSAANPANPDPDRAVSFGRETWDEMLGGLMQISWASGGLYDLSVAKAISSDANRSDLTLAESPGTGDN